MRFSMHDSWCNLLIKILDLTWICWEQGKQHCTSGGVALRRLETALRGGDSVHILLPNKALRALRHFWIPWWSQGGSILPSVYTTPSAAGNAIHPHHFVIVLCQSEYPRLRGFQCLVKPSPQNRPPASSNRECGWITARRTASPTFSTKHWPHARKSLRT